MKTIITKITISALLLLVAEFTAHPQGFINMDFEDAVITLDTSSPYYPYAAYASDAIPGWTQTGSFLGTNDITYDTISTGSTDISILDANGFRTPLDGNFSILLFGGETAPAASISQTAIVPASTESVLFEAQGGPGTLLVSLGGQNISYSAISTGSNYTLYGGNIPLAFAGQTEQLIFSVLEGGGLSEIDDIQFSPSTVPEPGALCLSGLAGVCFAWRCRRKSR